MNSDKMSTTGERDSEKKTMVASIVYTVYVTEKRGYQVNIDKKKFDLTAVSVYQPICCRKIFSRKL